MPAFYCSYNERVLCLCARRMSKPVVKTVCETRHLPACIFSQAAEQKVLEILTTRGSQNTPVEDSKTLPELSDLLQSISHWSNALNVLGQARVE